MKGLEYDRFEKKLTQRFYLVALFSEVVMDEGSTSQQSYNSKMDSSKEAALLALMDRTGYSMVQENGQRKFGGPPPGTLKNLPVHCITLH